MSVAELYECVEPVGRRVACYTCSREVPDGLYLPVERGGDGRERCYDCMLKYLDILTGQCLL